MCQQVVYFIHNYYSRSHDIHSYYFRSHDIHSYYSRSHDMNYFSLQVIIISVIIVIIALLVYTVGYFIAQCFAKRRIQNTGGYGALNERVSL